MKSNAVISVLGKDKIGIVAKVSNVLAECGVNIDDIRQTILEDIFSMTMLVTLDEDKVSFYDVQQKLEQAGEELGLQVRLQRRDVFDFMYKV